MTESEIKQLVGNEDLIEQQLADYKATLTAEAIQKDREHGPLLAELVPSIFIELLMSKSEELKAFGFKVEDVEKIATFIQRYGDKKIFYFLRNSPPQLSHLDKTLRDQAAMAGKSFDLPILSSTQKLEG